MRAQQREKPFSAGPKPRAEKKTAKSDYTRFSKCLHCKNKTKPTRSETDGRLCKNMYNKHDKGVLRSVMTSKGQDNSQDKDPIENMQMDAGFPNN